MTTENTAVATREHLLFRMGIYPPLAWGYLGLLLFMIGDGVESGYLSPYLLARGISQSEVAAVFTAYGVTAAVAAETAPGHVDRARNLGCLRSPVSAHPVNVSGIFDRPPLLCPARIRLSSVRLRLPGVDHRGNAGAPAGHGGRLVLVRVHRRSADLGVTFCQLFGPADRRLQHAVDIARPGGARRIPRVSIRWRIPGLREPAGYRRLAPEGENPLKTLLASVTIAWRVPKTAAGCVVRIINTAPQFGFLVFLPVFFTQTVGFTLTAWLRLLSATFLSNIAWNLLFGIIGDKFGWRRTVALCGGVGSAITTLLLYYVPHIFGGNYTLCVVAGVMYGATLAGYVPLSALMPSLAPDHRGAAMSMLNLGAGASTWVGPAIVGLCLPSLGVGGVMWIFAVLYLVSAALALTLKLPSE